MRPRRAYTPIKYTRSKAIPGQSLIPADLLKRHLAGTLPDIQKHPQFTHDENGEQISEDLSTMELHELHDLTVRIKAEYNERAKKLQEEQREKYRQSIIDEHIKTQTAVSKEEPVGTAGVSPKGDGAAG